MPEYIGHFINYKALKKLIKSLAIQPNQDGSIVDVERLLQENKTSFFFRLERELEKVNSFYLEKESDLKIRLDILIKKKNDAIKKNRLGSRTSIAYISLYDGFKRFSRDLDRLEQFIELNQTGFSKVLKKWDKRSKSHTKELYLSKAVSVQPVFNREEISQLSDLCANSLVELDAKVQGEKIITFEYEDNTNGNNIKDLSKLQLTNSNNSSNNNNDIPIDDIELDELYSEFINIIHSSTVIDQLDEFIKRIQNSPNAAGKLTRIFFLSINTKISDEILLKFYESSEKFINLGIIDDLTRRSMVHEACCNPSEKRQFIIELILKQGLTNLFNSKDLSGRLPLHYASELGKIDLIKLLCSETTDNYKNLNSLDYDSMSPLLLAIGKNHIHTVKVLLELGADPSPTNSESHPQYLPLNVACKSGNYDAAVLLLSYPSVKNFQRDAQGLLPLHVVAQTGNFQFVPLLTANDADPNELDGFNKWPPIFYSASEGHPRTTAALIKAGARIDLRDEENYTALFYASWEGHVNVLNVLIDEISNQKKDNSKSIFSPLKELKSPEKIKSPPPTFQLNPDLQNIEAIPDLSLPPPIIPLRRYGHNFLEKKIFVQLVFPIGRDSITLNHDEEIISSLPGRIVISSRISDVVPRNILIPIEEQRVAFQIDSLDEFSIDIEIFPTFGTKLIAKTSVLSNVFTQVSNDGLTNNVILPLFDGRLKNIGELNFKFHVIHPYNGIPLEITKYDTYWKSTSGNESSSVLSFVTSLSLSGDYIKLNICFLNDGTPVVSKNWNIDILGTKIPLYQLSLQQFKEILNYNFIDILNKGNANNELNNIKELTNFILENCFLLEDLLNFLPGSINLNLEVLYPTEAELKEIPITLPKLSNLDEFINKTLSTVFNHIRESRLKVSKARSIVFSSKNQSVCSILNWKQPNYPVFFNVNGLHFDSQSNKFEINSANGFANSLVKHEDSTTRSIKDATNFATLNNLLGIVVPYELLILIPNLIDSIRSRGLVLVASNRDVRKYEGDHVVDVKLKKTDINGVVFDDVLSFKGDIDM